MYFSTKASGYSTGLGQYFVKDLILKMNWDIAVDSKEGHGTICTIKSKYELPEPNLFLILILSSFSFTEISPSAFFIIYISGDMSILHIGGSKFF